MLFDVFGQFLCCYFLEEAEFPAVQNRGQDRGQVPKHVKTLCWTLDVTFDVCWDIDDDRSLMV